MKIFSLLFSLIFLSSPLLAQYPDWFPDEFKNKKFCGEITFERKYDRNAIGMGYNYDPTQNFRLYIELYFHETGLYGKFEERSKFRGKGFVTMRKYKYETSSPKYENQRTQKSIIYKLLTSDENEAMSSSVNASPPPFKIYLHKITEIDYTYPDPKTPSEQRKINQQKEYDNRLPDKSFLHIDYKPSTSSDIYGNWTRGVKDIQFVENLNLPFDKFCGTLKTEYEKEQERLKEQQRAREIESERQKVTEFLKDFYNKTSEECFNFMEGLKYTNNKNMVKAELISLLTKEMNENQFTISEKDVIKTVHDNLEYFQELPDSTFTLVINEKGEIICFEKQIGTTNPLTIEKFGLDIPVRSQKEITLENQIVFTGDEKTDKIYVNKQGTYKLPLFGKRLYRANFFNNAAVVKDEIKVYVDEDVPKGKYIVRRLGNIKTIVNDNEVGESNQYYFKYEEKRLNKRIPKIIWRSLSISYIALLVITSI